MAEPKISIIVPVYNVEEYLEKCIESLIGQTYTNIEIIFIYNKSTDNSLQKLQQYQKKDSRILIIEKENEGVSIARNRGVNLSTGEYIMFVDSDDWIDLDNCEKALKTIEKEQADILMWSYVREFHNQSLKKEIFNEEKLVFSEEDRRKIHRRFIGVLDEEMARPENADALCPVWGKLYKRELIVNNHISFVDLQEIGTYEDGLFNLEVFNFAKKVVYVNQFYYHYRKTNNASITSKYKPNLAEQWKNLFDRMEQYIECNHLGTEYKKALNNRIAMSILGLGLNEMNSEKSNLQKLKTIQRIISQTSYRTAYKALQLKYFPLHWKVFYGCAKYKCGLGIYMLLFMIKKIISN